VVAARWPPFETEARVCYDGAPEGRDVMNFKNLAYYLRAKLGVDESGQDLLEYALLVALIALVSVGVIGIAGQNVKTIFTDIGAQLKTP
jgi:Flp pilus assembly pilin Flp